MPATKLNPRQLQGVEVVWATFTNLSASLTNAESSALFTTTIPANLLGANGYIRWEVLVSYPNTDTKTFRIKVNGTAVSAPTATTTLSTRFFSLMKNRNATNSQVASAATITGYGTTSSALQTSLAFDTTADLTITGTLATTATSAATITFNYVNIIVCYIP